MLEPERQRRLLIAYIAVVTAAAIVAVGAITYLDLAYGYDRVNWYAFALFAALLVVSESTPSLWMRFGDGGEVTPGWSFAYALVLLGAPAAAVAVMVATDLAVDLRHRKGALKVLFNAAQIAMALATGGIILHAFGLHGGITAEGELPIGNGLGIVAGGAALFLISGLLTAIVISIHQGVELRQVLRAGFVLSMAADGALLALAPVFVIAIAYSVTMIPLLGVTTYLVYYSARNALRQQHEATHDPLTMLPNRRAFDQRIEAALDTAPEGSVAVMVMDLDRFKDINDRLGHQVGDRLLVSFADRLERSLPVGATASRLGGDEFGVLVNGVRSREHIEQVADDLRRELMRPLDVDGFPLSVAVSVGVASNTNTDATAEVMLAAADVAMYRAKRYDSRVEFRSAGQLTGDHGRIGLLQDLSAAIDHGQIHAHYQPQIDLADGTVAGVEALMRWNHPTHGPIRPSEFIGLAEQTDLIGPITELMFRSAMQECRELAPNIPRLAINVAPRSLLDRRFASRILSIVDETGFPPDHIEIEITERAIVAGSERTRNTIEQFRDAGLTIAIDDFGSGYSSFQVLRNVRANRLKIDRQFSTRLDTSAADELIVTKVIELAHGLGLDVVAEGVESRAVWNRLAHLGCDVAQGYAIARPMPFEALGGWLGSNRRFTAHWLPRRTRLQVLVP